MSVSIIICHYCRSSNNKTDNSSKTPVKGEDARGEGEAAAAVVVVAVTCLSAVTYDHHRLATITLDDTVTPSSGPPQAPGSEERPAKDPPMADHLHHIDERIRFSTILKKKTIFMKRKERLQRGLQHSLLISD